jgi:hypothetical protein
MLPALRPVELAACSSARSDVVVVGAGRETGGPKPPRSVVVGDSSTVAVVAVRALVVLVDARRAVVEGEADDPERLFIVVVEPGLTLVEVAEAAVVVVEVSAAVVLVGTSTVVLGSTSVVDGRVT